MNEQEIRQKLLTVEKSVILIDDDIDYKMYKMVAGSLLTLQSKGSPPVEILIDSKGGDIGPGLDIYDAIRLYPGIVTGSVRSQAASIAAIILQACPKRLCARHGSILIHIVARRQVSLDVLESKPKLERLIADLRERQGRLDQILIARTGKTLRRIQSVCKLDKYMKAEEALEFGLVDEII